MHTYSFLIMGCYWNEDGWNVSYWNEDGWNVSYWNDRAGISATRMTEVATGLTEVATRMIEVATGMNERSKATIHKVHLLPNILTTEFAEIGHRII